MFLVLATVVFLLVRVRHPYHPISLWPLPAPILHKGRPPFSPGIVCKNAETEQPWHRLNLALLVGVNTLDPGLEGQAWDEADVDDTIRAERSTRRQWLNSFSWLANGRHW